MASVIDEDLEEFTTSSPRQVAYDLRQLVQVHEVGANPTAGTIAATLGIAPFVAEKLARQAKHYRRPQLLRALQQALNTDIRLKHSAMPAAARVGDRRPSAPTISGAVASCVRPSCS